MDMTIVVQPEFIDGVVELHSQLNTVFGKATKIANKLIGTPIPTEQSQVKFSVFVDFSNQFPTDRIKGYFMTKNQILRFLPIVFDKALLFPVSDHGAGYFKHRRGISIKEIDESLLNKSMGIITFSPIRDMESPILYNCSQITLYDSSSNIIRDDIGKPIYQFPDIDYISIIDLPIDILTNKYTLVGRNHYVPFTTDSEINCVLFAQLDNDYDTKAIKVMRWFPSPKDEESDLKLDLESYEGSIFFELGYVSARENTSLHKYMIENNSRLLFGTIKDSVIRIDGGVKIFQTNGFKYPRCLFNIKLK